MRKTAKKRNWGANIERSTVKKNKKTSLLTNTSGSHLGSGRWSLGSGGCRRSQSGGGANFCCWRRGMGHYCPTAWERDRDRETRWVFHKPLKKVRPQFVFFYHAFARLVFPPRKCKNVKKNKKQRSCEIFNVVFLLLGIYGFPQRLHRERRAINCL